MFTSLRIMVGYGGFETILHATQSRDDNIPMDLYGESEHFTFSARDLGCGDGSFGIYIDLNKIK